MAVLKHIVIADPCPDNRGSLADLLAAYGYSADPVDGLDSLAARLTTVRADAVVTEVFGDPEQTCRVIRVAAPGIPIVFHTTRARDADVRASESLGCVHIIKPDGAMPLVAWLAGQFAVQSEPGSSGRLGMFVATRTGLLNHSARRQFDTPPGDRLNITVVGRTGK